MTGQVHRLHGQPQPHTLTVDLDELDDVRDVIPGGASITAPVAFDDDVWDLAGHPDWQDSAGRETKIRFTSIPAQWRTLAKLWTLASLAPAIVHGWAELSTAEMWRSYKEACKVATAQGNAKALGLGLQRLEAANIQTVDDDGWTQVTTLFQQPINRTEARTAKRIAPNSSKLWADQLRSLHVFGSVVGWPDPFGSEPWGEQDLISVFNVHGNRGDHAARRNSVEPHQHVGLVLGVAAFIIDELADDILGHATWWLTTHRQADTPTSRADGKAAATDLLRELAAATGGRLPRATGTRDTLAHQALAYTLGLDDGDEAYQWFRQGRRDAERIDGTTYIVDADASPCPVPIRTFPHADTGDQVGWTNRLLWDQRELHFWWSALLYSCAAYLCATLGLRNNDRDLLSLGAVRHRTLTKLDVPVDAWELHGWRQKQRMTPQRTTWPAGHRVRRAVEIVEKMHTLLDITPSINTATNEPRLFDFSLNLGSNRGGRSGIHLDGPWVKTWIKQAAARLHMTGVVRTDLDALPDALGEKVVRITTLQAYASRPLGMMMTAAMGQWSGSTAVMGGYVGTITADIVLPDDDEVAALQAVARTASLKAAADRDERGEYDTAAGQVRLRKTLERFPDIVNGQPLTRNRAERIGRQALHVEEGPYTTCFFQQDGALCGGRGSADFRLCQPGSCRNSAPSRSHRARLELRRRRNVTAGGIYLRNAEKIVADNPDLEADFAGLTDDELTDIVKSGVDELALTFLDLA